MDYLDEGMAAKMQAQRSVGSSLGNAKMTAPQVAISDRLRSIENAVDELASRTERLAYRLAGPYPEATLKGMAECAVADDRPVPQLLESIESAVRKIERNVERASEAT